MKNLKLTTAILTLTMLFSAFAPSVMALGVSPLRLQLTANPGDTVEGTVKAFSSKDQAQVVVLSKGDFIVDQNEDLQFMVEANPQNKYSLLDWIVLPEENAPLDANGSVEIKYTINVPEDAKSQSYYGVVLVSSQNPTVIEGPGGVGITTNVAQLVLLEVGDTLLSNLTLNNFAIEQQEAGVHFETSLINNGNTHDATLGTTIITDSKLNKLEELEFNKEKHNSMPSSPKTFVQVWDKFADYQKGVYFAYLNIKDENENPFYAEIKYRIDDKGKVETLKLTLGKSYEETLKNHNASPLLPIGIVVVVILIAAITTKARPKTKKKKMSKPCNKKRK